MNEFVEYELKIKAHNKCKNYDVIEAIEVNFDGILMIWKLRKMILLQDIFLSRKQKEK